MMKKTNNQKMKRDLFMDKRSLALTWTMSLTMALLLSGCSSEPDAIAIAMVGDKAITQQQFDDYLAFKRINANDEVKYNNALEQYVERETLAAAIEKTALLDSGMIEAELNEFRKEMMISRYFETYLKDVVSDQAIVNYYNANASHYESKQVHVAHLLFRTNRNMGETERQAKLTAANEAYSKIKAGEDFSEVAKQYSEDTISGKKGGDLGWLKQGAIDQRFSEKVFSMSVNDISEPFESSFGFHIAMLLEGPVVTKQPYDAVKGDIRYQLRNQAKEAELKRLTESKL